MMEHTRQRMVVANYLAAPWQEALEQRWKSLPPQARVFLLNSPITSINAHSLIQFWLSSPKVTEYATVRRVRHEAVGASWFIALGCLKGGMLSEARALLLNGAFLRQCMNTPIESVASLIRGMGNNAATEYHNLPFYNHGYHSCLTKNSMENYLRSQLSMGGYQHLLKPFEMAHNQTIDYCGDLDWSSECTAKKNRHQKKLSPDGSEETQIELFLSAEGAKNEGRCCFNIGSCTTMKGLFNEYADKRGVSLRSLRFSFNGRTLFLSSVGNKSPNELNMKDQDVINVHDNNASQDADSSTSKQRNPAKKIKAKKNSSHKSKGKGKGKKKRPIKKDEPVNITPEQYKAQHSIMLSQLHEELQPQLKEIRTRLITLSLERQPRKQRRSNKKKKSSLASVDINQMLPSPCGGKAGKPHFNVHVGEIQNLYKTTKPSQQQQQSSRAVASTLDLHGCTKDEALQRLDEHLTVWEETAMQGLYPFVIPAKIICGCGNQILSETVEQWIRVHAQVANAPKNLIC